MHLAIFSCAHGRAGLTRLWARHLQDVNDALPVGIDLSVHVAVTDGDTANMDALGMWDAFEHPNAPLGAKHNAALARAMASGADAFMVLPSDDFVSLEWVETSVAMLSERHYVCPWECALFDQATGQACVIVQRERGARNHGAARVFSRELVEEVGALYTHDKPKGLDTDSHVRITALGRDYAPCYVKDVKVPVTDVKVASGENLWTYGTWSRRGRVVEASEALWMVSDDLLKALVIAEK